MSSTAESLASVREKEHFVILDGLRGVAAVLVVLFHLFEAYSGGDPARQIINHGYLAVDFFFLLSGYVIAYAYDDRWGSLTQWGFYKRRLIRLQPMIIIGSLIGAALFFFQDYSIFPKVAETDPWQVVLVMLVGFALIPLPVSADIRGWTESYPLNGPAWSLFYEYIANTLYAIGLRKLSNKAMALLVAIAGGAAIHLAVFGERGDMIGGWSLDAAGIQIGLTRVMFPFFAGVLLMRLGKAIRVKGAFALCSLLLVIALSVPRLGGDEQKWLNGAYEAACIILLFPLIVAIGAGVKEASGNTLAIARFFGELSYPLYITHFPLIYIYTGWVVDGKIPASQGAIVGAAVFAATIVIAYTSLRFYDLPVRRWLARTSRQRG